MLDDFRKGFWGWKYFSLEPGKQYAIYREARQARFWVVVQDYLVGVVGSHEDATKLALNFLCSP